MLLLLLLLLMRACDAGELDGVRNAASRYIMCVCVCERGAVEFTVNLLCVILPDPRLDTRAMQRHVKYRTCVTCDVCDM